MRHYRQGYLVLSNLFIKIYGLFLSLWKSPFFLLAIRLNYLAHIALSPEDPDVMLGNFLADSVRPLHIHKWSKKMQEGYALHMEIDRFTDSRPAFKKALVPLRARHKKYAPVVLDILNDHLLAKNWEHQEDSDFGLWCQGVYSKLDKYKKLDLPYKADLLYKGLMEHRYLHVYQTKEGLKDVLQRMDKRASFPSYFEEGVIDLYKNLSFFEDMFEKLYSSLQIEFKN